jgi:EmrB/QacA subfamily drug resistance transporter
MIGLDDTVVSIGLPTMAKGFHASVSGLQWIADGYTMVLATFLIFGGATADRFGRRRIFRVGLSLFTISSALCSLAPSLGWLITFRVVQALGGSMLNPVAVSIISGVFTGPAQRARAISVWVGTFGIGMALGPAVGGVLIGAVGWRGIFWVNIPVGLCAIALTSKFVPESRTDMPRRPDPVGQVLAIVILGSLVYAIIEGAYADWRTATIRGLFITAAAALAVLVGYELRRKEPLIDPRYFRNRSFCAATTIAICAFANLGGFLFLTSIYLQVVRGFSPVQAGLQMLPTAAAMALFPSLAAALTNITGSARLPLTIGGLALMVSTSLMTRFTGSSHDAHLMITFGLFGVGMGMINSQISVAAVSAMPPGQAGLASGIASASRQVGQALGVAIAGSLLTAKAHGHMRTAFLLASNPAWHLLFWCASVVVVAGLLTTRVRARQSPVRSPVRGTPPAPEDVLPVPPGPRQPLVSQTLPMRVPQASEWVPRFMRGPLPPDQRGYVPVFPGDQRGWPDEDSGWRGWFSTDRQVGADRPALDGAPHVGGGQWHVGVDDAEWGERVDDRVHDSGGRADGG